MATQLDCPSCGASVKARRGVASVICQYCGNSVLVPEHLVRSTMAANTVSLQGKSCGKVALIIGIIGFLLVTGIAVFIFYAASAAEVKVSQVAASIDAGSSTETPVAVIEFGGPGTGPGYFQRPECIAIDANGHLFVGEWENCRVQVFDLEGEFITQWFFAEGGDIYLSAMSSSREGILYIVFEGSLYSYDGVTGNLIDLLQHPEAWGFEDVDVAPDGTVLASWYKHGDDILRFDTGGEIELHIEEAISDQTGDTELSTMVATGNLGEIYAYGSFNEVVCIFNSEGRFLDRFGNGDMLLMPSGMDVDPTGRLWISDFGDLLLFNPTGELLDRIELNNAIYDFVISDDMQLYGISADETIVQIDLSVY